jgi:hypothetical protein
MFAFSIKSPEAWLVPEMIKTSVYNILRKKREPKEVSKAAINLKYGHSLILHLGKTALIHDLSEESLIQLKCEGITLSCSLKQYLFSISIGFLS